VNEGLNERWKTLITLRGEISKAMEVARKAKVIGHSLDAAVSVVAPVNIRDMIAERAEDMRALLIISLFSVLDSEVPMMKPYESTEIEGLKVWVTKAEGEKCERCWIYSDSLGVNPDHPNICPRCLESLR
jgi:isoleucyl-tRNA synthetase